MGTFNSTCFITDMTIKKGTEVAVFITKKKEHQSYHKNLVSDIHTFYDIVMLPIFGQYNELGSLSKITKTKITDYYESIFGLPMIDFVKIVSEGRKCFDGIGTLYDKYAFYQDKNKYGNTLKEESFIELLEASNTKDLFDKTIVENESIYIYEYTKLVKGDIIPFQIKISFKENETNLIYDKYDYKENIMNSKTEKLENTLEVSKYLYQLADLNLLYPSNLNRVIDNVEKYTIIMTKKNNYLKLIELSSVQKSVFEGEFEEEFNNFIEALKEEKNNKEKIKKEIIELEESLKTKPEDKEIQGEIIYKKYKLKETLWESIFMAYGSDILRRFEYNRDFKKLHENILFSDYFKESMSDLFNFENTMDSLGKYYRLPGYGSQYGTKREKLFIEFLNESVQPKKRKKKEED